MAVSTSEKALSPEKAGKTLADRLKGSLDRLTVADASLKSGLSLQDSEKGMHFLVSEYRGHLSATSKGELIFSFPTGFTKPWVKIEKFEAFLNKVKKTTLGVVKFIVRAWISVVMVAYVAIFAAILIALSFANRSNDRDDRGSFGGTLLFHTLFRLVLDSLFWTFHPFSPFAVQYQNQSSRRNAWQNERPKVPFYEKVNRFFFGPTKAEPDPAEIKRNILQEIRYQKGRVGLSDVMRVSGLPREKSDSLMAKLMLDYDGDVSVTEQGGIVFSFPEIRKTASERNLYPAKPVWMQLEKLDAFTGNTPGSNLLIGGLNGFNLLMSTIAISSGWTVNKLMWIFTASARANELGGSLPPMPEGTPLVLGWIPFWFSITLFAIPVARWIRRKSEAQKIARENGRRGLLWALLNQLGSNGISESALRTAWQKTAGQKPGQRELVREILTMGGELEVDEEGNSRYRFAELESELKGVKEARQKAKSHEKEIGEVVFSSMQ